MSWGDHHIPPVLLRQHLAAQLEKQRNQVWTGRTAFPVWNAPTSKFDYTTGEWVYTRVPTASARV